MVFSILLIATCIVGAWFFYQVSYTKPADDWFETSAVVNKTISLPKDDAPHQAEMEWWYYNGHLSTESGNQYSFHHTVFLRDNVVSHMISHASVNDHQTGKHYTAQRRTGGNTSINTVNRFEFKQNGWLMAGGNGNDKLAVNTKDFSFDLSLTSTQAPVFHGGDGIITLDIAGSSYYYSRTRMAISGTLTIGDTTEKVTGVSWFDHQWGEFAVGLLSWDWFSLQFQDGTDLMIYHLHDKSNEPILHTGSITKHGVTEVLLDTDFTITPGKQWTSDKTGITYPIEWTINIPKKNINITTHSIVKNSEFDARLTTYNIYWEGAVSVQGSHTGQGFMELYGYTEKNH